MCIGGRRCVGESGGVRERGEKWCVGGVEGADRC